MNAIELAKELAEKYHSGQTDCAGNPYINHINRVYHNALLITYDKDAHTVALLHDIVEDTPVTIDDLYDYGFSKAVIDAVEAITKIDGEDYFEYLERVKGNTLATIVKLADLKDNMDMSRLPKIRKQDEDRQEKYRNAKGILESSLKKTEHKQFTIKYKQHLEEV